MDSTSETILIVFCLFPLSYFLFLYFPFFPDYFTFPFPLSIKAARCNKRSVNPTVRQEPRAAAAAAGTCCRCLAGQSTLDIFFSLLYNNNFQDVHAVLRNIYYDSNRWFFIRFGKDMCVCVFLYLSFVNI